MQEYLEYSLNSDALILGERIKGGIFRPSCKTLRWSTVTMALRKWTGNDNIQAVGVIDSCNSDYFVYSPTERFTKTSKIPIQTEFLTNVKGRVYILKTDGLSLPKKFKIFLGALISKGFGNSDLKYKKQIKIPQLRKGILNTRIPCKYCNYFSIKKVYKPVYGYLFESYTDTSGFYVKSLFEGSEVVGPNFLLEGENGPNR